MSASESDPYVLFAAPTGGVVPKKFLPYIDKIKLESEWLSLGFKVKEDEWNYKTYFTQGFAYGFEKVYDPLQYAKAIKEDKRITTDPNQISDLIEQGCKIEDFYFATNHLKNYLKALELFEKADFINAKTHILAALSDQPNERIYKDFYYDVCFELKEENEIFNELDFHKRYIENYYGKRHWRYWLSFLIKNNFPIFLEFLSKLNFHYDNLIKSRPSKTLEKQKIAVNNLAIRLQKKISESAITGNK